MHPLGSFETLTYGYKTNARAEAKNHKKYVHEVGHKWVSLR